MFASIILVFTLVNVSNAADILHRISQSERFTKRSSVDVHSGHVQNIALSLDANNWNTATYQVALSLPVDDALLDVSSVKACHLTTATAEHFTLHLSPDGTPFSIDYFLSPVPKDGSCPPQTVNLGFSQIKNTTLRISRPSYPPLPVLRIPPPLTPQGEAVQPQPEKNFLQKYWLYIATALVLVLFVGGPPEEDGPAAAGPQPAVSRTAPARR